MFEQLLHPFRRKAGTQFRKSLGVFNFKIGKIGTHKKPGLMNFHEKQKLLKVMCAYYRKGTTNRSRPSAAKNKTATVSSASSPHVHYKYQRRFPIRPQESSLLQHPLPGTL